MGHTHNLACLDCRVTYSLGNGPYSVLAEMLAEFDAYDCTHSTKTAWLYEAHRIALMLHDGHRCRQWSWYWNEWEPPDDWPEVDLDQVVRECGPLSTELAQAGAVDVDRIMVESGPNPYLEAKQLALRELSLVHEVLDVILDIRRRYGRRIDTERLRDQFRDHLAHALRHHAEWNDRRDSARWFHLASGCLGTGSLDQIAR